MPILISIVSGLLTAFFGWCGGRGDDYIKNHHFFPPWLLHHWVRIVFVSLVTALTPVILGFHSWWCVALIPLTAGALSTYWDWANEDVDNFYLYGLVIGLSAFPIPMVNGMWIEYLTRSIVLCLWMGIWSNIWKDADIEDIGRYFIIGVSMFYLI